MATVRKSDPHNSASKWMVDYVDGEGKRRRVTPASGSKHDAETLRYKILNTTAGETL